MLPHLWQRPATRKRWPDGVDGAPTVFFAKNLDRRHAGLGATASRSPTATTTTTTPSSTTWPP